MKRHVDVNCDLGEAPDAPGGWKASHEPALVSLITSANVACGGHAGDTQSMREVCMAATRHGVRIGAQVSYPDRANFGRVAMEIAPDALAASLDEQFTALAAIARECDTRVTYIKPHGALYNTVVRRDDHAAVVVDLAARHAVGLFGMHGSCTQSRAHTAGVSFVCEWFADRAYLTNGGLVARSNAVALIVDADTVRARTLTALRDGVVQTLDGGAIDTVFDTICVHSDTPGAAQLLRAVRDAIVESGATIANR